MTDPRITTDPTPPKGFCEPGSCAGPAICYRCRQECERRGRFEREARMREVLKRARLKRGDHLGSGLG
jgi:hypothetical protein